MTPYPAAGHVNITDAQCGQFAIAQTAVAEDIDRCPKISGGLGQCAHLVMGQGELLRGRLARQLYTLGGVDRDEPRSDGVAQTWSTTW